MKRTTYLLLILICPVLALAQGFTIQGTVDGLQAGSLYMDYRSTSGDDTTARATITDGHFTLTGKVAEPQLVRLSITEGWSYDLSFYLENAPITIHMIKGERSKTTVTGSVSNVTFEKLKPGLSDFFEYARQNKSAHEQDAAQHDARRLHTADSLWTIQNARWIKEIRSTITGGRGDYAALYYIQWLLFRPASYDTIRALYMRLSPAVRSGWAAKKFCTELDHLAKTAPGQPAPDVKGTDTAGHVVSLSAFKGKVVLLDFWASYCGPCRQENYRMQPFYEAHHADGFEIVSFSLDDRRESWLQAITSDRLTWPQVSELRGGASATAGVYDITDLPRNVLIDQNGRIYARDLHGESLTQAVEKLIGKKK